MSPDEEKMLKQTEYSLRWLISHKHISTSDFILAKDLYWRMHRLNHGVKLSREFRKAFVKRGLAMHHENQQFIKDARL